MVVLLELLELLGELLRLNILGVSTFGNVGVLLLPSFCYFIDFVKSLLVGLTDCVVLSERVVFII